MSTVSEGTHSQDVPMEQEEGEEGGEELGVMEIRGEFSSSVIHREP